MGGALKKAKEKSAKLAKRKGARTLAKKMTEKAAKLAKKLKNAKRPKVVKNEGALKALAKKDKEAMAKMKKKVAIYKSGSKKYKAAMLRVTAMAKRLGWKIGS